MRIFLVLSIWMMFGGVSFSQDTTQVVNNSDKTFLKGWTSGNTSLDVGAGVFFSDFKNLNNDFTTRYNKKISENLLTIGIMPKGQYLINKSFACDGHPTFQYVLPQEYHFNDSLSFKMKGYMLGLDIGKDIFPKSKSFDFYVGLGANTGRYKLQRRDLHVGNYFLNYTNPFFSPKIVIEPKVIIWILCFSVNVEYLFDVSNSNWNIKSDKLPFIAGSKATGFFIHANLGYKFYED